MNKEMPYLKTEIPDMKDEYSNRIRETKIIEQLISGEEKDIELVKEEIRKTNKKISDVQVILRIKI
jgi:hypothetical protein